MIVICLLVPRCGKKLYPHLSKCGECQFFFSLASLANLVLSHSLLKSWRCPAPYDSASHGTRHYLGPDTTNTMHLVSCSSYEACCQITLDTTHLFNGLFSRTTWVSQYQKGKTSLDFNEARDDRVLECNDISWTIMQTICTSLQTDNHTNTSPPNFYRPDALPDAQPTVSKH